MVSFSKCQCCRRYSMNRPVISFKFFPEFPAEKMVCSKYMKKSGLLVPHCSSEPFCHTFETPVKKSPEDNKSQFKNSLNYNWIKNPEVIRSNLINLFCCRKSFTTLSCQYYRKFPDLPKKLILLFKLLLMSTTHC